LSRQQTIRELEQKLSVLREQKDKIDAEADEWAKKRDKLNERFRNLREETSKLRAERDAANEVVRNLKTNRSELKARIHGKIDELNKVKQEAKTLVEKKPPRSHQVLQKEFETLEWGIQTTPLTVQEEKEIIEQVREIEIQLIIYRKLARADQRILELRTELKALDAEGKECHGRLSETAKRSQELHEKMLLKIEESKKTKTEADSLHRVFIQTKEKSKQTRDEMNSLLAKARQLELEIRGEEAKERKQNEATLRDKLERQAREKLRKGEKLTWEEFQMLDEKEVDTED